MSLSTPMIRRQGDGFVLEYQETYSTDPADLWQAITTPERLSRWVADYRGEFGLGKTWTAHEEDGTEWCKGTVEVCEPGKRLVTSWHAIEEEPSTLEVTLSPALDGNGTVMTLRHDGIQSIFYGAGWQTYLERLAPHLASPEAMLADEAAWQERFAQLHPIYKERFGALGA